MSYVFVCLRVFRVCVCIIVSCILVSLMHIMRNTYSHIGSLLQLKRKRSSNERKTVKATAKRRICDDGRCCLSVSVQVVGWLRGCFFSSSSFIRSYMHSSCHIPSFSLLSLHPVTRMALRCYCQSYQSLRSYFDCTRSGTLRYRP